VLHAALTGVAPELPDPGETFDNERVTLSPDAAAAGLGLRWRRRCPATGPIWPGCIRR